MEFVNKTVYDRKTLETMNLAVSWLLTNRSKPAERILSLLLPLAVFGSGFYLLRAGQAIPIAVFELVLGTFLLIWIPFSYRIQAWISSKVMLKNDPEYTITFREGGYTVSSVTVYGQPTEQLSYENIWKLCETSGHLLLLLGKKSAFILDKTGFVQGSVEDFRRFLEERTGLRFQKLSI